ncbi:MAG TPA: prolyl oligopeptidase family serine peptidase, partial [Ramlibacter sp.]|nr:prolyl oligopeptidase family serine peptidase [Ramlibacter sp.]
MTHLKRRDLLLWPLAAGPAPPGWAQDAPDPNAWLEAVQDGRALGWVTDRNAETMALVAREPAFARRRKETLAALSSSSNIQGISRQGEYLYNFFRSAARPHGGWRRATLQEYAKERPGWETLLNVDHLARDEARNIVFAGADVHAASERALVFLSAGGEDKVEVREFDLKQRAFLPQGFRTPTAKQWVTWHGPDELLIATQAGPDSVTTSGYAAELRRWKRGTDLLSAPVVLRAQPTDMQVYAVARRHESLPPAALLYRRIRFYESERLLLLGDAAPVPVDLPLDANAWLEGDWLMVALRGPWTTAGKTYAAGGMLAIPLAQATARERDIHVLLEGRDRVRLRRVEPVKDGFIVAYTDNLKPHLVFHRRDGNGFRAQPLPAPEHGLISVQHDRRTHDNRFWLTTQGPISPQVQQLVDADAPATPVLVKSQPHFFDASGLAVRQLEARSRDGTLVPYTVVGPAAGGGPRPTLLYGYGGFGFTVDLDYQRLPGINWLQYGGVMVLSHIRGGGEFGQSWYEAGRSHHRQVAFDDFIAVAEDLVERGITTRRQLGIYGASNGGALVSAVMVQRPELFGAVVSRVPLTDMLGFTRLFAGPSWTEEYGDPDKPADRAVLAK